MPIIKKVEHTDATRASKHDPIINEFIEGFEADRSNNALIFTAEEEGSVGGIYNRMYKVYKKKIESLGYKIRQIPINPIIHEELFNEGGRKMIVLAEISQDDDDESEEQEEKAVVKSPPL